jgi:rhamnulokinase
MSATASGARSSATTRDVLEQAAALARRFGSDARFSRAGGGNASAKVDDTLYIKPSGVSLASMTADGLMPLALAPLRELAETADATAVPGSEAVMLVAMAARLRPEGERRPSVECVFHALIPGRFIIHTHPPLVNALTCARDGEVVARDLFGSDVVWVPYVDPGLPLALEIARRRRDHAARAGTAAPDVALLQNHGLIVAGDDPSRIIERSEAVVATIAGHLKDRVSAGPTIMREPDPGLVERLSRIIGKRLGAGAAPSSVSFDGSSDAARLAGTADGRGLVAGGPLTPDQIVYTGSWPLWLELEDRTVESERALDEAVAAAVTAHEAATGESPILVVAAGIGLFATGEDPQRAETALELYLDATRVGFGALAMGGVRPLAPDERRFIETWEAEAYRHAIQTKPARTGGA